MYISIGKEAVQMPPIKLAFIGVGNMGQCAHLQHYAALPDCDVIALAELRPELGARVAARYGVPRVYRDHLELLDKEKPEALVCIQPFTRHGMLLPELLQAGLPILIEKPLASSVEQGERIVEAARRHKTWIMIGYHKRSDPATMRVKQEIERLLHTQELGQMRYVRLTMPPGDWIAGGFRDLIRTDEPVPSLPTEPPPENMTAEQFQDYIQFVNYYIHQINLLRHLLGEDYDVSYADPSGMLLLGHSRSGIPVLLEMQPYQTSRDWQETALVCFERGFIRLELPAPLACHLPGRVTFFADPNEGKEPYTMTPTLPSVGAMEQQARNFVRAVRGEAPAPCLADEALRDLQIARDYFFLLEKTKKQLK